MSKQTRYWFKQRLGESVATGILESVSDGLAATQKREARFTC